MIKNISDRALFAELVIVTSGRACRVGTNVNIFIKWSPGWRVSRWCLYEWLSIQAPHLRYFLLTRYSTLHARSRIIYHLAEHSIPASWIRPLRSLRQVSKTSYCNSWKQSRKWYFAWIRRTWRWYLLSRCYWWTNILLSTANDQSGYNANST